MLEILFLIFLTLKLTDVIDWSWWLVTSPLLVGYTTILIVVFLQTVFISKVLRD